MILFGHFHTSWEHRKGDRSAMVVPDWLETTRALAVLPDGQRRWLEKDGSLRRDVELLEDNSSQEDGDQR